MIVIVNRNRSKSVAEFSLWTQVRSRLLRCGQDRSKVFLFPEWLSPPNRFQWWIIEIDGLRFSNRIKSNFNIRYRSDQVRQYHSCSSVTCLTSDRNIFCFFYEINCVIKTWPLWSIAMIRVDSFWTSKQNKIISLIFFFSFFEMINDDNADLNVDPDGVTVGLLTSFDAAAQSEELKDDEVLWLCDLSIRLGRSLTRAWCSSNSSSSFRFVLLCLYRI